MNLPPVPESAMNPMCFSYNEVNAVSSTPSLVHQLPRF